MPYADNGGTRIHYRDLGAGSETMLLVMGLGSSGNAWWRLLPHLQPRLRLLVMDNRGTGESDRMRGPVGLADLVADAVAVLDHAGVDAAHVQGWSMGGMVSQHLALDHPDRVRSLVLGCTTAHARSGGPPWRLLAASALRPVLGPGGTWPIVAQSLYARATFTEAPERIEEDRKLRVRDATPPATVYAQLLAVARHDVRDRLYRLGRVPVTVVHGDEDRLVACARGRALAAGVPGARFVMIPACGHLLTTDAEEATVRAVHQHLDRCAVPAARVA